MRIERINDNQIKCTLSSLDLGQRNLKLTELAYGSDKARNLFREMLSKASHEVGFETENYPLMVEAIPLSGDSVVIIVTRVEDPDEFDTRFAKFAPSIEEISQPFDMMGYDVLEGSISLANEDNQKSVLPTLRVFRFATLDLFMEAATAVGDRFEGGNTLYKNPKDTSYYLALDSMGGDAISYASTCNILSEYGIKVTALPATTAYYNEHFEVIISHNAIQKMR